ncbi:MAG: hypothetical protein DRH37_01855 [Deltaproteobacteria bacterium]|nr:MAG: hypothetical protein DRH37_01855 [Deltaproteobacteria bacterium]
MKAIDSNQKILYLNPASADFTEDLPAAGRSSAKSALPEGKLFSKTAAFMGAFKLMRVMQAQRSHNLLILKA